MSGFNWNPLLLLLLLSRCEKWKEQGEWYDPLIPKWPFTPQAPDWWPGTSLPAAGVKTSAQPALPQEPGAPTFPGPLWELDKPPPAAVQSRAVQLLPQLWARGPESFHVEHTGARWIAYQAKQMGEKRGVVAFRLKSEKPGPRVSPPVPPRAVPQDQARAPSAPAPVYASTAPRTAARPRVVRRPVARPAPRPAPAPTTSLPTLRFGMGMKPHPPNESVRVAQQKLGISADGRFGNGTLAAVKAFQSSKGLTADGVVGAKTWTALYGSQRAA